MPPRTGKAKTGIISDVLSSVRCSVYVNLEDGCSDASKNIKTELRSLGATVEEAFAFGHTHMVWTNGPPGLLEAARALQIKPVSFIWVERCKQTGKLVDEADFNPEISCSSKSTKSLITDALSASANMELIGNEIAPTKDPDSPFFRSSRRVGEEQRKNNYKKSVRYAKGDKKKEDYDKMINTSGVQLAVSTKKTPKNSAPYQQQMADSFDNQKSIVPTASFREITPRNKPTQNSMLKRRSERISDNNDFDSQSQEINTTAADQVSMKRPTGRGASKDTVIPFQIEKPPLQKRCRKGNDDIDVTIPIAAQTQFSSPSFSQDPVLSTIRPDTVMKVSFEGITSQLESESQSQTATEQHQQEQMRSAVSTNNIGITSRSRRSSSHDHMAQSDSFMPTALIEKSNENKSHGEVHGCSVSHDGSFTESQMDIVEGLTAISHIIPREEQENNTVSRARKPKKQLGAHTTAQTLSIIKSQPKKNAERSSTSLPEPSELLIETTKVEASTAPKFTNIRKHHHASNEATIPIESLKTVGKCDNGRIVDHVSRHTFTKKLICMSGFEVDDNVTLMELVKRTLVPRLKGAQLIDFADETKATTHLIVPDMELPPRTLRVLFSLARGGDNSYILTENWLYACLEEGKWVNEKDYIHPRYAAKRQHKLFSSFNVYIGGEFKDPPINIIRSLLTIGGGTVTTNIKDANIVLINTSNEWLNEPKFNNTAKTQSIDDNLQHLGRLSNDFNVVGIKYLFDCLEKQEIIERNRYTPDVFKCAKKISRKSTKGAKSQSATSSMSIDKSDMEGNVATQPKKSIGKRTNSTSKSKEYEDMPRIDLPVVSKKVEKESYLYEASIAPLTTASPVGVSDRSSFPPVVSSSISSSGRNSHRRPRKDIPNLSEVLIYHKRNTITPDTIQSSQTILDTDIKCGNYMDDIGRCGHNVGASGIDTIGEYESDDRGTPETRNCELKSMNTIHGVVGGRHPLSRLSRNAPVVMSQDDDKFLGDSQGF